VLAPVLALACADAPSGPPGVPARVRVNAGDAQWGEEGSQLDGALEVRVVDARGLGVPGVRVEWVADDGGVVVPPVSVTDADGRAAARWRLGGGAGDVHAARAVVAGVSEVRFTARSGAPPPLALDELRVMLVPTYDGSGQMVHPDVAPAPSGAGLAFAGTPYPYGDPRLENPSLWGERGSAVWAWAVPAGARNPVAAPRAGQLHLSDPDLVLVPGEGLRLYYRAVAGGENVVELVTSPDGIAWSAPRRVAGAPSHSLVSPSIVRRGDGDWWMWSVDARAAGCGAPDAALDVRRSADGIHWSAPVRAQLDQGALWPWHVDVQWLPSRREFWALYAVKAAHGCTTPAVYLATSDDGESWRTYPSPVLQRGAVREMEHVVYRSIFAHDPVTDEVTLWYSGARHDGLGYVWRGVAQRRRRADLFADISRLAQTDPAPPPDVPPLVEWP
jgi:hypothetical protein